MWGSRTSHRKLVPLSLLPAHITNIRTRLIVMKRNSIRESEIWPQLRMRNSQRSVKVDGNKKSRLQLALSRMVPEGKAEIGVLGTRAGCHCSAQLEPYWIQWRWPFWVNVLEKKNPLLGWREGCLFSWFADEGRWVWLWPRVKNTSLGSFCLDKMWEARVGTTCWLGFFTGKPSRLQHKSVSVL